MGTQALRHGLAVTQDEPNIVVDADELVLSEVGHTGLVQDDDFKTELSAASSLTASGADSGGSNESKSYFHGFHCTATADSIDQNWAKRDPPAFFSQPPPALGFEALEADETPISEEGKLEQRWEMMVEELTGIDPDSNTVDDCAFLKADATTASAMRPEAPTFLPGQPWKREVHAVFVD
jgi:hypothetical protein